MSPHVLVTYPISCEDSSALAGQIGVTLRDRWVESRTLPLGLVTNLERYDGAVLGCSLDDPQPLAELAGFVQRRAAALEAMPVALFSLSAATDGPLPAAEARFDALCHAKRPTLIEAEGAEARRWSAQLSWTFACAVHPLTIEERPAWPLAAAAGRERSPPKRAAGSMSPRELGGARWTPRTGRRSTT